MEDVNIYEKITPEELINTSCSESYGNDTEFVILNKCTTVEDNMVTVQVHHPIILIFYPILFSHFNSISNIAMRSIRIHLFLLIIKKSLLYILYINP